MIAKISYKKLGGDGLCAVRQIEFGTIRSSSLSPRKRTPRPARCRPSMAGERSPYQFLQPKRSICQIKRMEDVTKCLPSVR